MSSLNVSSFRRSEDGAARGAVRSTTTSTVTRPSSSNCSVRPDDDEHTTTKTTTALNFTVVALGPTRMPPVRLFLLVTVMAAVAVADRDHGKGTDIRDYDTADLDDFTTEKHSMSKVNARNQYFATRSNKYSNTKSNNSSSIVDQWTPIYNNSFSDIGSSNVDTSYTTIDFINAVADQRQRLGSFGFNERRVRTVSPKGIIDGVHHGILYWCFRDQRVHDNWGLLYAQKLAIIEKVPLYFLYCAPPKFSYMSIRQYTFMFQGLKEIEAELNKLDIQFHFKIGFAPDIIPNFVKTYDIGGMVIDFLPLREYLEWTKHLINDIGHRIPIYQVDSHNVVPCWLTSNRQEYGPSTIRRKLNPLISEFLTEYPPVIKHPFTSKLRVPEPVKWKYADENLSIDRNVLPITHIKAGYKTGMGILKYFLEKKLKRYFKNRNNPLIDGLSNLSPWLHFGQISAQRCLLEASSKKYSAESPIGFSAFKEEIFIRKELSENYCLYTPKYDLVAGASAWARVTLDEHRNDERKFLYTQKEFERALTHDDLWNSAQIQMVKEGKMHRFLRMYWAKKILEWSITPEMALSTAIYLNNKYNLDGSGPNSYVGCMWAICGVHDRPWNDRPIIGTIRYLTYEGTRSVINVKGFVEKYGGIVHTKL